MNFPLVSPELAKRLRKSPDPYKYYRNIEFFLQELDPERGASVLEIGAGEGILVAMLAMKGFKAIGLEPGGTYVDNARVLLSENGIDEARVYQGLAEHMPFPDNSFDYVISYYTLEHVQDLQATFRETERVLKPSGRTFHLCPNYNSFFEGHFKVFMLPFMSKRMFRLYIAALRALTPGRSRMPSVEFAESLCFIRPDTVESIAAELSELHLEVSDGGVIAVDGGRMVFGNRKVSEKRKKSLSRTILYISVELLNRLRLGGLLYALMVRKKWYPNLKIVGVKNAHG